MASTKDCKIFIANEFIQNPSLFTDIYGTNPSNYYTLACDPKNWTRERRFTNIKKYISEYGDITFKGSITDIVCAREMFMWASEGGLAYLILEYKDGSFYVSDYIGD